jgi:release factor glutamine methyltransferase
LSGSLKFYFTKARKLSSHSSVLLRDFKFFLSSLDISATIIALEDDLLLSAKEQQKIEDFFEGYLQGIPLDYILKESSFFNHTFFVDSRVLIPRPETELMVEAVLKLPLRSAGAIVLEVGVGSGCISISLALSRPSWKLIASDISSEALEVAQINLKKFKVFNLQLIHSNWLSFAKPDSIELIVSNPPYIHPDDDHLKGLIHEPISALVTPNGIDSFKEIAKQAMLALKVGGRIIFEHGHKQKDQVMAVLREEGFRNITADQDLQGLNRFVLGEK